MKVDKKHGLQAKVKARVVRRSIVAREAGSKTDAIYRTTVLLLRLIEVDDRKVDNTRAYIPYTKRIVNLKLQEQDIIEFTGYVRSGSSGYHFVGLNKIQVTRKERQVTEDRVVGILPEHVSLSDYVEYVTPFLGEKEV